MQTKKPPSLQAVENLLVLLFYDIIRFGQWGKHPSCDPFAAARIVRDVKTSNDYLYEISHNRSGVSGTDPAWVLD